MSSLRLLFHLASFLIVAAAGTAHAQLTALARVDGAVSRIATAGEDGVLIDLHLSQPVPWRVFTLDAPQRLVIDLSEVDWPATLGVEAGLDAVGAVATGRFTPGWSRMVLTLDRPLAVSAAEMRTGDADGGARLVIRLDPETAEAFAAAAGTPDAGWLPEVRRPKPRRAAPPDSRLRVVIDPGHGGIDPGAIAGELKEADIMLTFARELREVLLREGSFAVSLTRNSDVFVPLETRITLAREAGAEVFLSLHADALPEEAGRASGATVYTLSDEASDLASQRLAERHDRSDLLAGVDLAGQSDEIALVLMDLARRETAPRAGRLAGALVDGIGAATGSLNGSPIRAAGFSVLKAPDFPSVLVELGFLSSERDRARLSDPDWRRRFAEGIREALIAWREAENRLMAAGR